MTSLQDITLSRVYNRQGKYPTSSTTLQEVVYRVKKMAKSIYMYMYVSCMYMFNYVVINYL